LKENNLGISINPAQVRLLTSIDDSYAWKALPGKEHLFKKQLSKHSIGAYMELWREVGVSFEAVLATKSTQRNPQESTEAKLSFTMTIEDLQGDNAKLANGLSQWKNQVAKESKLKELAEEEVNRLKIRIQAIEMHNQQLQQEVQRLVLVVDHFRSITIRSTKEVNGVLEKLKFELHSSSGGQDMGWIIPQGTFCSN
jgi:DNA repair exonuclease SbcCD ATPase subunit